ncbi:hypothetical protein FNV43_RR24876 [Rhamnella rubrinervis]|uniref:DUF674 domain-containing protein n=1 Tax=Rhamnella rubrinervis TaxID=2594499 RepID=A0A8K0DT91_9ROSA|nr:hypothetical protein FNV43_RR24876 [Rhamnella rubrinervis]
MATSNTKSSTMSLKLLVNTKSDTVLFAEAGKEFVDFLFTIMSLPVGTVIGLLSSNDMVGSLGKIAAVHNNCGVVPLLLPDNGKELQAGRTMYICSRLADPPTVSGSGNGYDPPMFGSSFPFAPATGYRTSNVFGSRNWSHRYVAQDPTATCPQCNNRMSVEVSFVAGNNKKGNGWTSTSCSGEGDGGFVKGVVTYMVMDDLEVTPMSTISSIALLNKFNVKEIGALQEMRVSIGMDEGLKLLKASLQSKTVLTDVFLGRTAAY